MIYEVIDGDKCSIPQPNGQLVEECYTYGCAEDDTRITGIEYIGVRVAGSTRPFFTTPRSNVVEKGMMVHDHKFLRGES